MQLEWAQEVVTNTTFEGTRVRRLLTQGTLVLSNTNTALAACLGLYFATVGC
jgi:hypothetical protein